MTVRTPVPAARRKSRRISDGLTWLGGADREILALARSGRNQFVQMGLVVLATAGLGVLSMGFALYRGLHLHPVLAVLGGLVWGCVIGVIDRFLITSLSLRGGFGRVATVIGIRIVIAALLGFIISTPLVLQVFQREIQAQMVVANATNSKSFGDALNTTPLVNDLNQVRADIATQEAALRGQIPAAVTPEMQAREQYLKQAQDTLNSRRAISDQKYRAWQCELYGSSCEGSTNVAGNGNLAKAREKEYQDALAQTNDAQQDVTSAETALAKARDAASNQGGAALKHAQDTANTELPGLRAREAELQRQYNDAVDLGTKTNQDNTGLLAQIVALDDLGAHSAEARLAHIAVGLLFFMIELLPVTVKILTSFGPETAYERVRRDFENTNVDDAKAEIRSRTRDRDEVERRMAKETKKREDIEDDMRNRERDLGIKANERVAKEMEGVLDVALAQWAQDVQRTLSAKRHQNGHAAPPPPPHNGHQPTQPNVRSNFNLPSGSKLAPPNGNKP
ncbi:DUF4407 domain-containing protein [Amycolatopsis pithecellobii]|uniref:DUF4407 domain-containing protein n=1 Tax=Amycolatopsis pithecellobii TaxID=664692 RepID=A0A6N7Z3I0_9PSEU|nr:DUF4407 domain-containing protein [Amycolatopsis pithecellobii]MTD54791.1 DUF4407 domain-containing protein [Amycolatopsis pithecellobii]